MDDARKELKELLELVISPDVGPPTFDYVVDEIMTMINQARLSVLPGYRLGYPQETILARPADASDIGKE